MKNKLLKIIIILFTIMLAISNPSSAYEINADNPMADKSQVIQFAKDRNASEEFVDSIDYIYEYSQELGIDPTIVIAISSLETGYGKSNLFKNYHNPGGIKAKNGWKKFKTIRDGYKYMIELLATYSGKINKTSWLYNKATTTQELGNYYWVENGCDKGYHKQLTIVINKMLSYPIKNKTENKTKGRTESKVDIEDNKSLIGEKKTSLELIKSKLNKSEDSSGMNLILKALNK